MSLTAELVHLAKEPSSDKRRALLRQITDMFFLDDNERNVSESALFEEIVLRVAKDVDVAGRTEFAERIADQDNAPRNLVLNLAKSEIEVARPVLARSNVLVDSDLVAIAAEGGDNALQAISERRTISEIVTDVLVRRGSQLVARSLASNEGAKFSQYGFGELVRRSEGDEMLQMGLATREDLPAEVVARLAPLLSDKLKRTLVDQGLASPDSLSPAMIESLRSRMIVAVKERERDSRQVSTVIADLKAGKTTIDKEIMLLAKGDRAYDLATVLAELTGIAHAMAIKALTGTNDETLIVLFRLINAQWSSFESVLQMRAGRLRKNYVPSNNLMRAYNEMDNGTAQRVMRFLNVRRQTETAS
jgi:uncharacterized protein (DUF2336 family)